MKIVIDGVKLSNKPCGLSNIALSIIIGLSKTKSHDVIVIMKAPPDPFYGDALMHLNHVKIVIRSPLFFKKISFIWSIFYINGIVKSFAPDLFIAPNFLVSPWRFNNDVKTVLFVHDLVIKEYPETMHWFNRLHMMLLFRYSLLKADLIWCNSYYSSNRLRYFYPEVIKNKKVFVGSSIQYFSEHEVLKQEILISDYLTYKPYILYVGTIEPRKNIKFLIKIFNELYNDYNLVMISGKGWGKESVEIENFLSNKPHLSNKIIRVSNISSSELKTYYTNAAFLISTSLNEGLGLPVLEAMFNGCPVITPRNSAFIEIVQGTGVTVEGWNVADWLSGIEELIRNRSIYIRNGYNLIKKYNWDDIISSFIKFVI